jgi:hypothetical protein
MNLKAFRGKRVQVLHKCLPLQLFFPIKMPFVTRFKPENGSASAALVNLFMSVHIQTKITISFLIQTQNNNAEYKLIYHENQKSKHKNDFLTAS